MLICAGTRRASQAARSDPEPALLVAAARQGAVARRESLPRQRRRNASSRRQRSIRQRLVRGRRTSVDSDSSSTAKPQPSVHASSRETNGASTTTQASSAMIAELMRTGGRLKTVGMHRDPSLAEIKVIAEQENGSADDPDSDAFALAQGIVQGLAQQGIVPNNSGSTRPHPAIGEPIVILTLGVASPRKSSQRTPASQRAATDAGDPILELFRTATQLSSTPPAPSPVAAKSVPVTPQAKVAASQTSLPAASTAPEPVKAASAPVPRPPVTESAAKIRSDIWTLLGNLDGPVRKTPAPSADGRRLFITRRRFSTRPTRRCDCSHCWIADAAALAEPQAQERDDASGATLRRSRAHQSLLRGIRSVSLRRERIEAPRHAERARGARARFAPVNGDHRRRRRQAARTALLLHPQGRHRRAPADPGRRACSRSVGCADALSSMRPSAASDRRRRPSSHL